MRQLGVKSVTVVHDAGSASETRIEVEAHIQPDSGFFPVDTPIDEGDLVEYADPRGDQKRRVAAVKVFDVGSPSMHHIHVEWGRQPAAPREAVVRRLGIEGLHNEVKDAASALFTDGHYSQSVFEALKALEHRVRSQSGLDLSGRDLMAQALAGDPPPINLAVEAGQSGRDEQEGLRLVFMGLMQGVRNPKGHGLIRQDDSDRALEYLAAVSVLFAAWTTLAARDRLARPHS